MRISPDVVLRRLKSEETKEVLPLKTRRSVALNLRYGCISGVKWGTRELTFHFAHKWRLARREIFSS
jgi:hypothetical protein